jgi:hypothetical protein
MSKKLEKKIPCMNLTMFSYLEVCIGRDVYNTCG